MKTLAWLGIALTLAGRAWATQTLVATYDWQTLAANGKLLSGTVSNTVNGANLVIANTNGIAWTFPLMKIEAPRIRALVYSLEGEVACRDVVGAGYLEMWSHFPPAKSGDGVTRFFSRTLGTVGPMQRISGNADWRRFVVVFDRSGSSGAPSLLEFNLILPGTGTVMLRNLRLMEYSMGVAEALQLPGAWFSDRTAGWIGGCGGSIIGCLVPALGWLSRKGKCRKLVLGTAVALVGLGAILSIIGITALASKQPYGVWFVFLLSGVLLVTLLPPQLLLMRKNFDDVGMRKLTAQD